MSVDRRYWDSDAFLGWLLNEHDKAPKCEGVLRAAEAGQLQIVTSALTLTEVIRLKGKPRLPRTQEDRIRAFFEHDWIVVRDVDRFIAEDARELIWSRNVQPKGCPTPCDRIEPAAVAVRHFRPRPPQTVRRAREPAADDRAAGLAVSARARWARGEEALSCDSSADAERFGSITRLR